MSGRPVKYLNDTDRLNAAKEQRRASYERNKDKYRPRANLRAKKSYYKKKYNEATDESKKAHYMELIDAINKQLE